MPQIDHPVALWLRGMIIRDSEIGRPLSPLQPPILTFLKHSIMHFKLMQRIL